MHSPKNSGPNPGSFPFSGKGYLGLEPGWSHPGRNPGYVHTYLASYGSDELYTACFQCHSVGEAHLSCASGTSGGRQGVGGLPSGGGALGSSVGGGAGGGGVAAARQDDTTRASGWTGVSAGS